MCTGLHGAVWFWLPRNCSKTGGTGALPETVHKCPHHCPSTEHAWMPSRNAAAILHCAFCGSSVGDLCMAVQHVPVPGPPALSMVACCSGNISLCTASGADRILDCSSAKAMSRAKLFGGTPVCRLFRGLANNLHRSLVRRPRACLVQFALLASFSTDSDPRYEQICLRSQSSCNLRVHLEYRSVQCFACVRHYCPL